MVETLIKNGRVYDGTGSDWFSASVAIEKAKCDSSSVTHQV